MPAPALQQFEYRPALDLQRELVERRRAGSIPDVIWFLEHAAVVTLNPGRGERHLKASRARLEELGIEVAATDRGGEITYHGPGQLVGYLIVDLAAPGPIQRDLHRYLRALEVGLIEALAGYGISGRAVSGRTGVWVGNEKIAAIGVRTTRWVTSHGFALNVDCNLEPFRELIVPCGISDAGVTSMVESLGCESRPAAAGDPPEPGIPPLEHGIPMSAGAAISPRSVKNLRSMQDKASLAAAIHGALESSLGRRLEVTWDGASIAPARREAR